jgi:hypothetical protein
MVRREGWELRLDAVIEAARATPYALGGHDCFRLACRVLEALTGVDRWPEFAGYTTKREALELLAAHGHTFEDAFDAFFACSRVHPLLARRGDIVALSAGGEKHLGVCLGHFVAALQPEGLLFLPLGAALCCWRIG